MKDMSSVTNYLDMDNKELFNIYSQDKSNKEVRDILIERNLYLVNILAKKYINKGVEFEDLYQVGSLALIYAIERYDMSKGYEFSSFATPTIIGEIKKYFRDKVWTMRVPRRVQELSKRNCRIYRMQRRRSIRSFRSIIWISACFIRFSYKW